MRICYFADGRYIHTKRWMRFFAEKGHEMHLVSFAPMTAQNLAEMKEINVQCHADLGNFHLKRFWLTFAELNKVKNLLRREKIDILHCHFLGANAWYAALSGFHPFVITIQGADVSGPEWKPNSNLQEKLLTPFSLKKADLITSWSHLMAKVIKPYVGEETPVEVVHGGVSLEKFFPAPKPSYLLERWQIPTGVPIVFSPRLIRPLYNITQIAYAAKKISAVLPDVHYVIAFPKTALDIEYSEQVKQLFGEYSIRDKVRFVSDIPHDEIADYFRAADATISIPATDGTPMSVLESMACGTPTIIGNLRDYDKIYFENEKTTLMVEVNNPQSIAEAVLRLLKDVELTEKITAEARRRVIETAGYESQMSKMEQLYKSLI